MLPTLARRSAFLTAVAAAAALIAGGPAFTHAQTGGERTLFVSALDGQREPIDDLRPEDVVIREDGVRREVLRVSRATEPIDIALLADNSAAAAGAILDLRASLHAFVGQMTPAHQVALVGLADRPTILVDYTSSRERLDAAIDRLFPMSTSGMTLLDAILEVSRGLERRESARAVIVAVINDGVEFTTRYYRDVTGAVEEAGAQLHAVTVGSFYATGGDADRQRALVLDVGTVESGGQRIPLLSPMGLQPALTRLARELSSQYKVVYSRPESLIPPEQLDIASGRPGVTLRGTPMRGQPGA